MVPMLVLSVVMLVSTKLIHMMCVKTNPHKAKKDTSEYLKNQAASRLVHY